MSTPPKNNDYVDGPLQYPPQWVRELNKSTDTRSFDLVAPRVAREFVAQESVSEPYAPKYVSEVVESTDLEPFGEVKSGSADEEDYVSEVVESTDLKSFCEAESGSAGEDVSPRLGLGLGALISDIEQKRVALARERTRTHNVPIESLRPNPRNPRKYFDDDLDELTASIRERGIIQPIIVRDLGGMAHQYEIIAGERRWRAAQRAGLHDVPVALRVVNDVESLELGIIENVQRADLNPLEEASAYQALIDQNGRSQYEIAKIVGKSRSHVANTLRLLKLSDQVKEYVHSGKLSAGHARMLVGQPNAEELAQEIVERGLNVRQVEAVAQESSHNTHKGAKTGVRAQSDVHLLALEKRLSDLFGLTLSIDHRGQRGVLRIRYTRLEQLDKIAQQLERGRQEDDRGTMDFLAVCSSAGAS